MENKKDEILGEKIEKNAQKIEKTENFAENGDLSRTRMHAVYVQKTKEQSEDHKSIRGGRMGLREK